MNVRFATKLCYSKSGNWIYVGYFICGLTSLSSVSVDISCIQQVKWTLLYRKSSRFIQCDFTLYKLIVAIILRLNNANRNPMKKSLKKRQRFGFASHSKRPRVDSLIAEYITFLAHL